MGAFKELEGVISEYVETELERLLKSRLEDEAQIRRGQIQYLEDAIAELRKEVIELQPHAFSYVQPLSQFAYESLGRSLRDLRRGLPGYTLTDIQRAVNYWFKEARKV